ncbi:MAG: SPOR domain-containing protein [Candidatus Omnitrophica bacterium]|nr:SPOR domain-containing protein [Candidatus Omnitrophota bacterium]
MEPAHAPPIQPELFANVSGGEAGRVQRRPPVFTLGRVTIPVPLEQGILGTIILLLVMVVTYALGVERGRGVRRGEEASNTEPAKPVMALATPPIPVQAAPVAIPVKAANRATPAARPVLASAASAAAAPFTIQLATFSTPALAQRDLKKLERQGYHPFLMTSGKYVVLCVDHFATKAAASKRLAEFRKGYHDCFVRQSTSTRSP